MRKRSNILAAVAASLVMACGSSAALAQGAPAGDPVAAFNAGLPTAGVRDLSPELFPALAAMEPLPDVAIELRDLSLMTPDDPRWGKWEGWAKAAPQQAVIAALKKVAARSGRYVLGLKYGESNADSAWVKAGLYVDLGKPELLAGATRGAKYLDRLDLLNKLCTVEAARLAKEKQAKDAMDLLVAWARFGRIVADRPFAAEKIWAYQTMLDGLERLRDIACSHPDLFTAAETKIAVDELDIRSFQPERIRFPGGERAALQELMARVIEERGGPKPGVFAATMAGLTSQGRSVNRFAQAGYWSQIEAGHANWFETRDQIAKVLGDWEKRWNLNNIFDPIMDTQTDWTRTEIARFAIIHEVLQGVDVLFDMRIMLQTELLGTRAAMGVVGYRATMKNWPPELVAVQPRFIDKLDPDPWFFEPVRERRQDFRFYVPIRDEIFTEQQVPEPRPVAVNMSAADVAPADSTTPPAPAATPAEPEDDGLSGIDFGDEPAAPAKPAPAPVSTTPAAPGATSQMPIFAHEGPPFVIGLTESDFVLYSVGPDGIAGFAESVGYGGNDILIWPPVLTLERRAIKEGLIGTRMSFGGGGGGVLSFDDPAAVIESLVAAGIYDAATGNVDAAKLRESMSKQLDAVASVPEMAQMFGVMFQMMAQAPVSPDELAEGAVARLRSDPSLAAKAAEDGLTSDEYIAMSLELSRAMFGSRAFQDATAKAKRGDAFTAADVRAIMQTQIDAMTSQSFIDKYLKKILAHRTRK